MVKNTTNQPQIINKGYFVFKEIPEMSEERSKFVLNKFERAMRVAKSGMFLDMSVDYDDLENVGKWLVDGDCVCEISIFRESIIEELSWGQFGGPKYRTNYCRIDQIYSVSQFMKMISEREFGGHIRVRDLLFEDGFVFPQNCKILSLTNCTLGERCVLPINVENYVVFENCIIQDKIMLPKAKKIVIWNTVASDVFEIPKECVVSSIERMNISEIKWAKDYNGEIIFIDCCIDKPLDLHTLSIRKISIFECEFKEKIIIPESLPESMIITDLSDDNVLIRK